MHFIRKMGTVEDGAGNACGHRGQPVFEFQERPVKQGDFQVDRTNTLLTTPLQIRTEEKQV